jgi:hypothetical protein
MARKQQPKEAPVFAKSDLIAAADYFGVQPEIVAGALHDKEEATNEETKNLIKAYLTKPKGATE